MPSREIEGQALRYLSNLLEKCGANSCQMEEIKENVYPCPSRMGIFIYDV